MVRQLDVRDRDATPDVDAHRRRVGEERRVERRSVEPHGGVAGRLRAVREPERRAVAIGELHAHRGDRAGDPGQRLGVQARVAELADGGRRGEHAAGAPAPRRCPFEQHDLVAGPCEVRGGDGARGPATDHHDVDGVGHVESRAGFVAPLLELAHRDGGDRDPVARERADLGHRSEGGAASSARSSIRVYARCTESGPSWRVYRLRVVTPSSTRAPSRWCLARTRSLTMTPIRATRAASRRNASASGGSRWWTSSEAWTTSKDRSGQGSDRPSVTASSRPSVVPTRGSIARAASSTSARESTPVTRERAPTASRASEEVERDVRPARPHVEQRVRHGAPVEQPVERPAGRRGPAHPAVDPREVAQVATQRVGVVERPVEELPGAGESAHLVSPSRASSPAPPAAAARAATRRGRRRTPRRARRGAGRRPRGTGRPRRSTPAARR